MSLRQATLQFGCLVSQGGCDSLINIQTPGCFRVSKTAAFKLFLLQPRVRNKFYVDTAHISHHTTLHTHTYNLIKKTKVSWNNTYSYYAKYTGMFHSFHFKIHFMTNEWIMTCSLKNPWTNLTKHEGCEIVKS